MVAEVAEAIWKIDGSIEGPTITIMGGVHGNERTGIRVVERLHEKIQSGEVSVMAGTLFLILGNPKAIKINQRGSAPHQDLNRSFPIDLLDREPDGTYEDERAREIAPILAQSDVVVDLHATNKPSEPFLACLHSEAHADIYRWFPCMKVLTDPNFVLAGTPVTTDEYAEANGGIGICYETGLAWDTTWVDGVLNHVMNFLRYKGLLQDDIVNERPCAQEIFEIVESIELTEKGFEFNDHYGERSWDTFSQGDIIGHHGEDALIPQFDGVIVFPKLAEHWKVGKPVGYLAKRVKH